MILSTPVISCAKVIIIYFNDKYQILNMINDNNEEVTITEESRLEDTKIRYILLKDGEEAEASKSKLLSVATDRVIDTGTINSKDEITYSLRIWIDSKAGSEVMNKIFKAKLRIDAIQAKKEVTPISFSEDDWSTIASAVKSGNLSAYNVGDTKIIDMGDYGMHTLRISNTSECTNGETSETACGFVVEFADIITTRAMNSSKSNVGGWPASQMRTFVNSTIYSALPSELQDVIANTIVISSHGSTSGESNFNSTDKLYLLSRKEIWNTTTGYSAGYDTSDSQTRQLEYYKNKGVTQSNYSGAIKQYKGSNAIWWLRSASSLTTDNFFSVSADGNRNYYASYTGNGVSPAFRIK